MLMHNVAETYQYNNTLVEADKQIKVNILQEITFLSTHFR